MADLPREARPRLSNRAGEVIAPLNPPSEVADWLCGIGYPLDFRTTVLPPRWFQPYIEEAWIRRERETPAADVRNMIADEGGWA